MKEKKVTIFAKGASVKQWSDLILELNLMKKAWYRYGVTINIQLQKLKRQYVGARGNMMLKTNGQRDCTNNPFDKWRIKSTIVPV